MENAFFTIKGTLYKVFPAETKNSFTKREFILGRSTEYKDKVYNDFIKFEGKKDVVKQLDGIPLGSEVTVDFTVGGREWTSKDGTVMYFNSLGCFKIEVDSEADDPIAEAFDKKVDVESNPIMDDSELPF